MLYLPKAYPPKCFRHLNKIDLPEKFSLPKNIFPPLKKELNLTIAKRAAQACQVGRVLDTPGLTRQIRYRPTGQEFSFFDVMTCFYVLITNIQNLNSL